MNLKSIQKALVFFLFAVLTLVPAKIGMGQGMSFRYSATAPFASNSVGASVFHSDGFLYVGTFDRIEVFDSQGKFVRSFESIGEVGWGYINGMCELPSGNLLLTDYWNSRIREITTNGIFVRFISCGSPQSVIALPDGGFIANDHSGPVNTYNSDGTLRSSFQSNNLPGMAGLPCQMILSKSGVLHVTYFYGGVVQRYSLSGQFLGQYGQSTEHKLSRPYKIAQLSDGNVLVQELDSPYTNQPNKITVYTENGTYVGQLNVSRSNQVIDDTNFDIASNVKGQLLVTSVIGYIPGSSVQPNTTYFVFDELGTDKVPPVSKYSSPSPANWSISDIYSKLTSTDSDWGSGVKEIHYSINMGAEQIVPSSTASFTLTETGTHSISYFAVDNAGNTETTQYATVKIDKIAPITTLSQSGGLITLSATDVHSGVSKIKYQVNGGVVADYSAPFADTIHKVSYWAEDAAGNIEAAKTDIINAGVQSVAVSLPQVTGGIGVIGTVTLDKAAGVGGTVVNLASAVPGVAFVDPTVTVPEGATTAAFDIDAMPVSTATSVSITASIYETSQSALVNVLAPMPSSIIWSVSPVPGGTSTTGTLSISGPAPTGGTTVSLASSSLSAIVGTTVTIPAGAMTASFTVSTNAVSNDTSAVISATVYGAKLKSTLSILGPKVTSVTLASASIASTTTTTGTVTLSTNAPVGGKVVSLSSSNAAVASVPVSVTVPAGTNTVAFTITAGTVIVNTNATITATTNGSTGTATITVTPPAAVLSTLTTNVAAVTGGVAVTGTVTLTSAAPTGGAVVTLSSSSTTIGTVPASVTVAAGATSATFTITTRTVTAASSLTITGTRNGVSRTATITVNPVRVVSTLVLNPTSVKGGTNSIGTVTLSGVATEAVVVTLTSGTTTVARVPTSVTVPAGSTTATFTITTLAQTATRTSVITAATGTTTRTATLSVTR